MSVKVSLALHIDKPKAMNAIKRASARGLHDMLDYIAAISKAQVPLDQGPLMRSCAVDVASDGTQGTISYDTPYAVRQHECTWYNHQRGRKAKYLEDPVNDRSVTGAALQIFVASAEGEL